MFRRMIFVLVMMLVVSGVSAVQAGEGDAILKILLKKGVITEQEYKAIKEELKAEPQKTQLKEEIKKEVMDEVAKKNEEAKKNDEGLHEWTKRIKLSGLLEGEYRWKKYRDISDKNSDSTSDLYIRRLELGLDAELTDWIKANTVLNSEWIGDSVNNGDEKITADQATITLQKEDFPLYLVLGKRPQPFGVFENHLVTDPMTQDAYETKKVGITAGFTGPLDLDVSATVYKGEEQMDHLVASGLFEVTRDGATGNDVGSYILSASVSPVKDHLNFFLSYLSEPGRGSRNDTASLGISAGIPGLKNLRLDSEYMKALKRERYLGFNEAFKEGVFSLTGSYVFNTRERHEKIGGAELKEQKAHVSEEPIELALRFEHFDDDGLAEKTSSWSAENRYSAGARYSFYHDEKKDVTAYVGTEFRYTNYRLHSSVVNTRADNNKELFLKLGLSF
ncbi:MAG: LbtU family siderophore porin [Nitrospiraceae bacterium]|nr:MAG: LbtU family siderophore porin [Nitrospiraceae bacterium]